MLGRRSRGRAITVHSDYSAPRVKNAVVNHVIADYSREGNIAFIHAESGRVSNSYIRRGASFATYRRSPHDLNHPGSGVILRDAVGTKVDNNLLTGGWGETIIVDVNDGYSQDTVIEDNIVFDNYKGVYIHATFNVLVRGFIIRRSFKLFFDRKDNGCNYINTFCCGSPDTGFGYAG